MNIRHPVSEIFPSSFGNGSAQWAASFVSAAVPQKWDGKWRYAPVGIEGREKVVSRWRGTCIARGPKLADGCAKSTGGHPVNRVLVQYVCVSRPGRRRSACCTSAGMKKEKRPRWGTTTDKGPSPSSSCASHCYYRERVGSELSGARQSEKERVLPSSVSRGSPARIVA